MKSKVKFTQDIGSQSSVQSDREQSNHDSNDEEEDDDEIEKNQKQSNGNDCSEQDSSDGYAGYENNIHTIREDPDEGSEDESIDYIEQRIKKLEIDLQDRLQNHHPQVQKFKKQQPKIVSKPSLLPPNPQSKSQNKMNYMNSIHKPDNLQQRKPEQKKIQSLIIPTNIPKPKKSIVKQTETKMEIKGSVEIKRAKVKKDTLSKSDIKIEQILTEQADTDNRICELEMVMKQLKMQNQVLKQKLDAQKVKNSKIKTKTSEVSAKTKFTNSTNSKLQKQIDLLDVIQKLQAKLKKSINRKLSVQSNGTSLLTQKGIPIQANY